MSEGCRFYEVGEFEFILFLVVFVDVKSVNLFFVIKFK